MTYATLVNIIEQVAQQQHAVAMVVPDNIERLNHVQNARYGAFVWQPGQASTSMDNDLIRYNFTLFYADRLVEDKANEIEVQSTGIEVLGNVIRTLSDVLGGGIDSWTLDTFSERLADVCAGAYASVAISVPVTTTCAEVAYLNWKTSELWQVIDANGFKVKVRNYDSKTEL